MPPLTLRLTLLLLIISLTLGSGAARTKARDKVTVCEKLDEGLVEATLISGQEESDPIEFRQSLQAFSNIVSSQDAVTTL